MGHASTRHDTEDGSEASFVRPLQQLRRSDFPLVGGKAANLGELLGAGLPVPGGFCVTTAAFRQFLAADPSLEELLTELDNRDATHEAGSRLRQRLSALPIPTPVEAAVRAAWMAHGPELAYAVRSSATTEDLPNASFAGQHETLLDIRGCETLLAGLRSCWISLFSERALVYRAEHGMTQREAAMAVVVQELVAADVSGVLFTADPLTGRTDRLLVEGCFGLGAALVSGQVNPDRFVLEKGTGRVLEQTLGDKSRALISAGAYGAGTVSNEDSVATCDADADSPCLEPSDLQRLAELGQAAEHIFGAPQDIEWAFAGGRLCVLQARAITALGRRRPSSPQAETPAAGAPEAWLRTPPTASDKRQVWTNANVGEVLPDVNTPLNWTLVVSFFKVLLRLLLGREGLELHRQGVVGLIAGRAYFNVNAFTAFIRALPGMRRANVVEVFGGHHDRLPDGTLLQISDDDLPVVNISLFRTLLRLPRLAAIVLTHTRGKERRTLAQLRMLTEKLERTDLASLTDDAVVERLRSFAERIACNVSGVVGAVFGIAAFRKLHGVCRAWLDDADGTIANRLLAGVGGLDSAEAGLALWRLAVAAQPWPELTQFLLQSSGPPQWEVITALPGGAQFQADWQAFLQAHGHHARGEIDIYNPRWRERPEYVLDQVRNCLRAVGKADPLAERERHAAERQTLTEQCRQRLRNPLRRAVFLWLLRRAQRGLAFRENIKSEAVRQLAHLRLAVLELGARLTRRGLLAEPEDIFFLDVEELDPVRHGQAAFDVATTIAARRAQFARHQQLAPPPVVVGHYDPEREVPAPPAACGQVLRGLAVSPGVATGRARVLLRSADGEGVLPGEILIAPFTDPGWTPYFLPAAGIVVDMGGMLSHGSIIAREYGLPAVVNVGPATRLIRTGQLVRVDGDRGIVTVLPAETPEGCR